MTEATATTILSDSITPDGLLHNIGWYLSWKPGAAAAILDGQFTADDLEAIAWWMRHHPVTKPSNIPPRSSASH